MKTTYIIEHEDSKGNEIEKVRFEHFNQEQIQTVFDAMVLNASEGDSIEYSKIDDKYFHPCMLYVEIIGGKPYTFTRTGLRKEYHIKQML